MVRFARHVFRWGSAPAIWDLLPSVAILIGWIGLTTHVVAFVDSALLPLWAIWFLIGLPSAMLVFAATAMLAREETETDGLTQIRRFARGSRQAWAGMAVLACLPLARSFPNALNGHLPAAIVLAAMTLVAWMHSESIGTTGSHDSDSAASPVWGWGLLALTVSICVLYFAIGHRVDGSKYWDGNYYYGVARHMASTGRFEEPIVWHFLSLPQSIIHAPFDYWSGMTSVILVPVLWLLGSSYPTALLAMTAISALSLIGFWYLITVACPIRHPLIQLTVLLIFSFSPAVHGFRFDTESIPVAHLFLILALIAFYRRRYVWAVTAGFLLALTRADGMFLCLVIWVSCLAGALHQPLNDHKRGLRSIAGSMAGLSVLFSVYHLWAFGTLFPPGAQVVPHLESLADLVTYNSDRDTSVGHLLRNLHPQNVVSNLGLALAMLRSQHFVPAQDVWLVLSVLAWFASRSRGSALLCSLLFVPFLSVHGSHTVFSPRAILSLLPVLILAGGVTLDALSIRLRTWRRSGRYTGLKSQIAALLLFAMCATFLAELRPYDVPERRSTSWPSAGRSLDKILDGEPVAACNPYELIAYTRSPAISIPRDGAAAIDELLHRYNVRWLLLPPKPPAFFYSNSPSDGLLQAAYTRQNSKIGSLQLKFVTGVNGYRLFRLTRSRLDPPSDAIRGE